MGSARSAVAGAFVAIAGAGVLALREPRTAPADPGRATPAEAPELGTTRGDDVGAPIAGEIERLTTGANPPRTGAAALRARLARADPRGAPAEPDPVVEALGAWSAGELAAFSRYEQLTGRPAPRELVALVLLRRRGATEEALAAESARLFAGDPLGRAAALDGVRRR